MEITTGSRIWLRRRGARPLVLVVSEVIGGSLVARDAPHAVGRFCAYLVIDPATAETDAKGRTTYRPAEGTGVYTARHAAVEAAGSLGAETCPACGRVSPTATPGLCGPCGIAADLAAVAREIATEPDDAELMAAWQDAIEPGLFDAPDPGEDREAPCPVCHGDLVVLAGIDDAGEAHHRPCPCTGEDPWAAFGADVPPPFAITGTIAPSDWPMPDWLARGLLGLPVVSHSDQDIEMREAGRIAA